MLIKDKRKKLLIIIFVLVILVLSIYLYITRKTLSYKYFDNYTPGTTYDISLNKKSKILKGRFYHACSTVDCKPINKEYSVKLTNDEYKKIMIIWHDKAKLSPILESICKDEKIMYNSFEESYEDNKDVYNKIDRNADGKISSREYANNWLDIIIKETHKKLP